MKRRTPFAAGQTRRAKATARQRSQTLEFWYRRKFNLAPNDPRFLDLTAEDIETEYYTHYYADNPATEEVEDDDFDKDAILAAMARGDDDWETIASS